MTMPNQPPTPPATASPEALRRAQVMWEQSGDDLRAAKRKLREREPLDASFFALQAAVNALAAVARLSGEFQLPHHSPMQLLGFCADADDRFAALHEPCVALEAVQEQDPFRGEESAEALTRQGKAALAHATTVHKTVRAFLKTHRKRYFAP
jgi:HEPN domain-containing protein